MTSEEQVVGHMLHGTCRVLQVSAGEERRSRAQRNVELPDPTLLGPEQSPSEIISASVRLVYDYESFPTFVYQCVRVLRMLERPDIVRGEPA